MKNYQIKITLIILLFLSTIKVVSQNLYAGIEIGGKGLKVFIIDIRNLEKDIVVIENFWSDNISLLPGIIATGAMTDADMTVTSKKVVTEYNKVLNDYKIEKSKIYVVISSGVGIATNTNMLIDKLKKEIDTSIGVITTEKESKFLFKNGVPVKFRDDALLLDIGSGNTKGGFYDKKDGHNKFMNLNMNLGTMSLSELLSKQSKLSNFSDYVIATDNFYTTLNTDIKQIYDAKDRCFDKKKIYISGGSPWAFYTLFYEDDTKRNFLEFNPVDVLTYDSELRNNFEKFIILSKKNKEVARVLKTFTRENLIVSNSILKATIANIKNINSKKIFFAKQPEVSWVVTYICDELTKGPIAGL